MGELALQAGAVGEDAGPGDGPDVRAALGGDGDAYARLVARYQQPIGSYMWRFTRDRVQWEELVHDVFVEAYLSLRGYRGEAPLLHWLRKIATRVGYRWWKRRTRQKAEASLELQEWDQVAAADLRIDAAREAGQQVHALLATLPARDRLVLTLLYLEECSVAEAARLCGWSRTMVKVQAFRARKKLKKLLERGEPSP
jgi:RNA polymerase sigma-70 factor (ECF subfamily)